jgi:hypothetical protein
MATFNAHAGELDAMGGPVNTRGPIGHRVIGRVDRGHVREALAPHDRGHPGRTAPAITGAL